MAYSLAAVRTIHGRSVLTNSICVTRKDAAAILETHQRPNYVDWKPVARTSSTVAGIDGQDHVHVLAVRAFCDPSITAEPAAHCVSRTLRKTRSVFVTSNIPGNHVSYLTVTVSREVNGIGLDVV